MSFESFLRNIGNSITAKIQEMKADTSQQVSNPFKGSIDASVFSNTDKNSFLDKISEGMKLNSNDSIFYQNIDEFGVDKIFDYFDKNGDGIIQDEEIKDVASVDENDSDISGYDLYYSTYEIAANELLEKYGTVGNNGLFDVPNIQGAYDTLVDGFVPSAGSSASSGTSGANSGTSSSGAASGGNSASSGAQGTVQQQETNESKLDKIENEELPALEQKKQEVIDKAQEDTDKKNEELDKLIEDNKKELGKLGEDYSKKQDEIKDCDDKISDLDKSISESESNIHGYESTISNLEAELGALDTNTNDEKINESNKQRKSEIESKLKEAKDKKAKEEEKIDGFNKEKEEQVELKAKLEDELANIQKEIDKKNPQIAQMMGKIQEEIKSIEEKKTSDVKAIDEEIKVKREEAVAQQKTIGETKGAAQSGPYAQYNAQKGQALASTAHNVRGTTGWCLAGVNDSLQNTDGFGQRLAFEGAYQAIPALQGKVPGYEQLASNFKEVSVAKNELTSLPAGAVVVWDRSQGHQWGHISIALGDGRESSDFIGNQMTNRDADYHVFIPV